MRVRIVTDNYNGYEVQVWHWYWPFWVQPFTNSSPSVEHAEKLGKKLLKGRVVKYVTSDEEKGQGNE